MVALRKFTPMGIYLYAACESIRKARTLLLSGLEPKDDKGYAGVQSFKIYRHLLSKWILKIKMSISSLRQCHAAVKRRI